MTDHASNDPTPEMPEMPLDPFGPMHHAAAEMHVVYTNFIEVGFSEAQALELVKTALSTQMQINAAILQAFLARKKMEEGG